MRKLFALFFTAAIFTFAACEQNSETTETIEATTAEESPAADPEMEPISTEETAAPQDSVSAE